MTEFMKPVGCGHTNLIDCKMCGMVLCEDCEEDWFDTSKIYKGHCAECGPDGCKCAS